MRRANIQAWRLVACWLLIVAAGTVTPLQLRADPIRISDAWVREPLPGRDIAALYMQLRNDASTPIQITGVRVADAESAAIHESVASEGMMSMRPVPLLELAPGASVSLAPGGYHVMVFGLKRALRAGEQLGFCVLLRDGRELCGDARVRGLQEQGNG